MRNQMRRAGALAALLLLAFQLSACQESTAEQQPDDGLRTVRLETVGTGPSEGQRRFVGRVDALSTVDLSFQVGGRILSMPVQQGAIVPAGGLIAELDKADYERAVREAQVALDLAELDHARSSQMLERGAIPQASYDRSLADLEMRRLALDAAQRNLGYASIEAPFDALVTRRLVDAFTQVQAGTRVVRVQDVTELRVHIAVPETLMGMLQTPERFEVTAEVAAYPGKTFSLSYREHATEADPVTQTYQISFGLPRAEAPQLLPGMTATVTVKSRAGSLPVSITVPASALDTEADGSFRVWVYDPDSQQVSPREVVAGALGSQRVLIESGLQPGEQIVTAGAHLLRPQMRVTPYRSER
jgi:RND family efflux transporter MFP subunit